MTYTKYPFLLVCCIVIILGSTVLGQKVPMKFGKIDPKDLEMKVYDKDTSAEAVILGDYGESVLTYDTEKDWWIINYERLCRIKILKKEGTRWANQLLDVYKSINNFEKLGKIRGCTYNLENGKVVKESLGNDAIFTEELDKHNTLFKFTLPNVREGSVIEYTYAIQSNFFFRNYPWTFQYSIPAVFSEYRLEYPEYFNYKLLQKGYLCLM